MYAHILLTVFFTALFHHTTPSEYFSQLNLLKIPSHFSFYDTSKITFKNKDAYQNVINTWQHKIQTGFNTFFDTLFDELQLTPENLQDLAHNEDILHRYHLLKGSEFLLPSAEILIRQDEMDPDILFFLQNMLFKYTHKRNVTFYITNQIKTLTATYGSDRYGHHVFCHSYLYSKQSIMQYHHAIRNKHNFFYLEKTTRGLRYIENPSLLQAGLIEAASSIEHQTNLFSFILCNYSFRLGKISESSITMFNILQEFITLIEAIFQSKNPLEVAQFLSMMNHNTEKEQRLWNNLVKDIAQSYDAASLQKNELLKVFLQKQY
ncbi:hypothetical protein KBD08_03145 [Candidatus Babeliales bacterium]|nr:hypothetical protein [Candidatus Babeliales bacterium]